MRSVAQSVTLSYPYHNHKVISTEPVPGAVPLLRLVLPTGTPCSMFTQIVERVYERTNVEKYGPTNARTYIRT